MGLDVCNLPIKKIAFLLSYLLPFIILVCISV